MLNIVWPIFIIISFIYSILSGNIEGLNNSIFESTKTVIELSIKLLGTMCLWMGIMGIATHTSVIDKLTKVLKPIIKFLFKNIDSKSDMYKEISMNMVANILGLGNAATPLRNKSNENDAKRK